MDSPSACRNVQKRPDLERLGAAAEAMDLPAPRRTQFDHRTKTEHLATILLPNPVAAHDTERGVVDCLAKILK